MTAFMSGQSEAEEIILNLIEPFRVVGEIALLDRSTRSARLVALDDCQFIKLPVGSFDALRNSNQAFAAKIIANVTSTLRESNDQLRVICTYRSLGKVAWCLDRLVRRKEDRWFQRNARSVSQASRARADDRVFARNRQSRLKTLKQKNCITPGSGDGIQVHAAIARYTKRPWPLSDSKPNERVMESPVASEDGYAATRLDEGSDSRRSSAIWIRNSRRCGHPRSRLKRREGRR